MSKLFMGAGDSLQEVRAVGMDEEGLRDIEFRIKAQPHFLGEALVVVADSQDFPQVENEARSAARTLIALDTNGQAVAVEIKQGIAPSETAFQSLKFASFLARISPEELGKIAHAFITRPENIQILRRWRESGVEMSDEAVELSSLLAVAFERDADDYANLINRTQRIIMAAEAFDSRMVEVIEWMSQGGIDIRGLQYKKYLVGGQEIFFAEQVVPKLDPAIDAVASRSSASSELDEPWRIRGLSYYAERLIPALATKLESIMAMIKNHAFATSFSHKYSFMVKGSRRTLRLRAYHRDRLDIGFFNGSPELIEELLKAYGLLTLDVDVIGGYGSSPFVTVTSDVQFDSRWERLLSDWLNGNAPGLASEDIDI